MWKLILVSVVITICKFKNSFEMPTIKYLTQCKPTFNDVFHIASNQVPRVIYLYSRLFVVPTPLEGGGTIYSNGFFFVQPILADRYIHRRELRLISLESLSSVEIGIKKLFSIFVFLEGVIVV